MNSDFSFELWAEEVKCQLVAALERRPKKKGSKPKTRIRVTKSDV